MSENVPWKKLGKYFTDNCTPKERKEIEQWIQANPSRKRLINELEGIWEQSATDEEWDVDEGWDELSKKLSDSGESPLRLVESPFEEFRRIDREKKQSRRWSFGIRVAAAVAVLAVFVLSVVFYMDQAADQQESAALAMQEVVTQKGQRSQFKLSDGTQVWLNGDSRMKIPSRFTTNIREVYLEGEAFFAVKPNPEKPFIIHAGESLTRVLGTQFNLQAYPDEAVQIVVKEGKVAFGNEREEQESAELVKNQMGVLNRGQLAGISNVESIKHYTGWTDGQLIFKDTPLNNAVKRLERWFDIDIKLNDPSLESRTITGRFKEESMTEILNIIALSVGMSYEKDKNTITFYKK